jgi:hypothetical protein
MRAMAARAQAAVRRVVAYGLTHGFCNHELAVVLGPDQGAPAGARGGTVAVAGVRVEVVPLAMLCDPAHAPGLAPRARALRPSPSADVVCVVWGRGPPFIGYLRDLGLDATQPLDLPPAHPALQAIEYLVHQVAPGARHDVLAYARAHGLAPTDVAATVYARPNADSDAILAAPPTAGACVADLHVGRRAVIAAQARGASPELAAQLAAAPAPAHFWLVAVGFGVISVREAPLLDPPPTPPAGRPV